MNSISRSHTIRVKASLDETLPLFTATGECLWVVGWNPTYVYPESGESMQNMIWTTNNDNHTKSVWVTVDYDVDNHIATYIKFMPDTLVSRIDIRCYAVTDQETDVNVTYTLTALTEKGHAEINQLTESHFVAWINSWEKAINHYLALGEILQPE